MGLHQPRSHDPGCPHLQSPSGSRPNRLNTRSKYLQMQELSHKGAPSSSRQGKWKRADSLCSQGAGDEATQGKSEFHASTSSLASSILPPTAVEQETPKHAARRGRSHGAHARAFDGGQQAPANDRYLLRIWDLNYLADQQPARDSSRSDDTLEAIHAMDVLKVVTLVPRKDVTFARKSRRRVLATVLVVVGQPSVLMAVG